MTEWKKEKPYEGVIHQGCLNCPAVEETAPMNMVIGVGFGHAAVLRDGVVIFQEQRTDDRYYELAEFETMAESDPDHDWRVILDAPLRSREYQRHGKAKWVLIDSGQGFA